FRQPDGARWPSSEARFASGSWQQAARSGAIASRSMMPPPRLSAPRSCNETVTFLPHPVLPCQFVVPDPTNCVAASALVHELQDLRHGGDSQSLPVSHLVPGRILSFPVDEDRTH